jgi:hypothetical protein
MTVQLHSLRIPMLIFQSIAQASTAICRNHYTPVQWENVTKAPHSTSRSSPAVSELSTLDIYVLVVRSREVFSTGLNT